MPRYTQPRKTWFYPVNFNIKAVELSLRDDVMSKDVAEALDIHPLMLSRWRKEYRERINKTPILNFALFDA
ncbi:transposase [Pseudoalteromonas agarivorans]|uniref:transposase n=1 Tax=Pseudoalteromonas TaxID=53246 RepID=UPI0021184684|nr:MULTISPECIES: transposase [Pseudoalteromonas]MCQ8885712.1 transposase [Pseudoalteromonas agarivorans]